MQEHPTIETKRFETGNGEIRYFRANNSQCPYDILFIHGLGADKEWFPEQFDEHSLDEHSWLVPDLLGFGQSAKPQLQDAYTMDNQADILMALLIEEGVKNLVILAHSMGGPIAVSLIERVSRQSTIEIFGLFYLEGNLDADDAYLSGKFATHTFEEYAPAFQKRLENIKDKDRDLYQVTKAIGPFPFWASSIDLVKASKSNQLLPRIQKFENLRIYFIFGELNKGRFSSEELIGNATLPILHIPDAGHMMYIDNPREFWRMIFSKLDWHSERILSI